MTHPGSASIPGERCIGSRANRSGERRPFHSPLRACFLVLLLGLPQPASAQDEIAQLSPYAQAVFHGERALEVATIGDWQLACDNTARCTMLGHADFADPNHVVANTTRSLGIRLEVGAQGEVDKLEFIPDEQVIREGGEEIDWSGPFVLSIDNLRGSPVEVPFNRVVLAPTERGLLVDHLRGGLPLTGTDQQSGELRLRFPYVGFAEALEEIRRRQGHITQWREAVQPDDGPVHLVRGTPVIISGRPAVTAEQMDWCGSGIDAFDLLAFAMGDGPQVWQHSCPVSDGRNRWSRWFQVTPGVRPAQVIRFAPAPGFQEGEAGSQLPNATFEADFGIIQSYNYAWPGREDCGSRVIWGWTGADFVPLERRVSLACRGIGASDWLVTWRRVAISDGESGE